MQSTTQSNRPAPISRQRFELACLGVAVTVSQALVLAALQGGNVIAAAKEAAKADAHWPDFVAGIEAGQEPPADGFLSNEYQAAMVIGWARGN